MLDGRGVAQGSPTAQIVAAHSVAVGLFAAPPTGVLPSLGALSGATERHLLTAARVFSRGGQPHTQTVTYATGLACTTTATADVLEVGGAGANVAVSGSGCHAVLGPSQTQSSTDATVTLQLDGLVGTATMDVWYPTSVSIAADDPVLNRITGAGGSCATPLYQQTRLYALVDGLDATARLRLQRERRRRRDAQRRRRRGVSVAAGVVQVQSRRARAWRPSR